ncbi:threonine/serine exporter family protein [Kibdelosporangium persicum]|uniref:Amino acid export carrier protein n=1 Tax=Kibdelosporangium persicum TaxID=2698649 RepID=A0ABX2F4Q2_9PSEU|nr:Amino acid export carrier protein [Kibdelosporangium persicum]
MARWVPDPSVVNQVLDLALRIGEVQLSSGAGASDVTATISAVANACGLDQCEVDVTFTSITVCCHRGPDHAPVTSLRVVRSRGLDYTRLAAVEQLVRDITRHRTTTLDAARRLDQITQAKHPYPRWVATAAWAGMAASVTVLLGAGPLVALVAAVITAVIDRIGRVLNRYNLPFFFQQVIGGALATGGSLAVVSTGWLGESPTLVVAAAITVLLSGLSVVGAVQDAITGYTVTASGRVMEVALMTAGLIGGVVLALNMAKELGLPTVPLANALPPTALRLPVQALAGAAAAGCFALASYATMRSLMVASAAGALGALGYGTLVLGGAGPIVASAVAAAGIGFCGGVMAGRLRVTPLVVAVSGMTPLFPGLTTYRSLYELAVDRTSAGVVTLMTALGIALALGAGVVLGEYLAQPVRTTLGRLERRLGPIRLVGPTWQRLEARDNGV